MKATAPRERKASPEELAEDRRSLAAKQRPIATAPTGSADDLRATHGKNGVPELEAVSP